MKGHTQRNHVPCRLRQSLVVVCLSSGTLLVCWLALVSTIWQLAFSAPLLLPLGLFIYGHLHNHFHRGGGTGKAHYDGMGILLASLLGVFWTGYRKHHANHHRFNNGPGDYSTTLDKQGNHVHGVAYLRRNAVWPFLWQLLPFLTYFSMKSQNRTKVALFDEGVRVAIRLVVLGLGGISGLFGLLAWQFTFFAFLFYANYLQHFRVPIGQAVLWGSRLFNLMFGGLGWHDQHHRYPSLESTALPTKPSRTLARARMGIFDPVTFLCFLISPELLGRRLLVGNYEEERLQKP